MRKLYLASYSPARQELLKKIFGRRFKVVPSRIKEERSPRCFSYAQLVKRNALAKAKAVAEKVKDGIVVGADTIVVQDGKIFGKPKNIKAARRMLRKISARPQWVYTGLVVIDKRKGRGKGRSREKTLVDYEKTRVVMDRLTDKEIDNYFRRVSPLDKAGSFDIQGKGAFFIRRIEGCFYNVVGLPLRKLYLMLKRLKVKLFLVCLLACLPVYLFLCGCSTEYNIVTGQEETFFYSTDKEVRMGEAIAQQVEKEYKLVEDPLIQKRAEDIGKRIASVCDRKDIDYRFKVLQEEEINAFALPGGSVYINKGLIDKISSDDELAGLLGHEVGHIVARHSIKKLQAILGYSLLRILVAQAPAGGQVVNAADLAFTEILLGYARDDELLADQLSARYARIAGYDPRGMINFLKRLQEIERRKPLRPKTYFKTHPYVPDRIRVVKQELGEKISFTDYINIEEKE